MRRDHARRAARHRLHDGHPEPFEARREDERLGAAVPAREVLVADEAEPDDALVLEHRLIAPTRAPGDGERVRSAEERVRLDERAEVLARLECRNAEEVR